MKKATLTIRPYKNQRFVLDLRSIKQGRKFYASRDQAREARTRALELLKRHGGGWLDLPRDEQSDIMKAREELAALGATVRQAANHYTHYLEKVRQCNITVAELRDKVMDAKQRDGKSERYLESLRGYLGRFCRDFGSSQVATVTPEELDTWLRDLPYAPKSRLNFRQHIGVLFSAAKRWRMVEVNPIEFTERPKIVQGVPGILNVGELEQLLNAAQRTEPDTIPMLAIGFFAGLRTSEIHRLLWQEISLERGEIEVTAAKSKSAKRRFVPIQQNLAAWLRPFAKYQGPVVPEYWRGKLARAFKESGLVEAGLKCLPHNAVRHSYCSYLLALNDDAPKVAASMGHSTSYLIYQNYRALVRKSDAVAYFAIVPARESANVLPFQAANVSSK